VTQPFTSLHFPFLTMHLTVGGWQAEIEAFVDTGFDGGVSVPWRMAAAFGSPSGAVQCIPADGSEVWARVFDGTVQMGAFPAFTVGVIAVGEDLLVGRQVTNRFGVNFDHGQRIIVEP